MNKQPQSIFQNMKMIIQGVADAAGHTTNAVGTVAQTADSLANAGLIMAQSNERIVTIDTDYKEKRRMQEIENEFKEYSKASRAAAPKAPRKKRGPNKRKPATATVKKVAL